MHGSIGLGRFQCPLPRLLVVSLDQHQRQRVACWEITWRLHVRFIEKLLGRLVVAGDAGDRPTNNLPLQALGIKLQCLLDVGGGCHEIILPEIPLGRSQ